MSSGRGECISSTEDPMTCLLHQPLMALICQPQRLCRVTRTLKVPKWQNKAHVFLKVVFCFVWCIISCFGMLRLYDYMFALSYGQLSMLFIFVLLLFISVCGYILCSYFTLVSLSSHSAPRSRRSRVRRHPPSSRSLSLRSAWPQRSLAVHTLAFSAFCSIT